MDSGLSCKRHYHKLQDTQKKLDIHPLLSWGHDALRVHESLSDNVFTTGATIPGEWSGFRGTGWTIAMTWPHVAP